ncbi:21 kDa protein-like [Impatiens glandulifera]|uniref:21 kDa protein-like n=1 Tax=Impatiens glandulifera TaxID=253017 RepID=UPI001FB1943D|nr:21 kDa protein-like [Impatiens glandulifera]
MMHARVWTVLIVTIHLCLQIAASLPTNPTTTYEFIETSCSNTTYPDLCLNTLSPYADSIGSDNWKLCTAALNATISSSRVVASTISKIARKKGISKMEAAIVADCIENIRDSIDEMKQSLKAINRIKNRKDRAFQMDNIKTWMSAAITDDGTCTDGFAGTKMSNAVKAKIGRCVVNIGRLTSNALSLINHLEYY